LGLHAGDKFREVATTKLLTEGLTALTEVLRELDAKLERVEQTRGQAPILKGGAEQQLWWVVGLFLLAPLRGLASAHL
jgi:hypothetical protein